MVVSRTAVRRIVVSRMVVRGATHRAARAGGAPSATAGASWYRRGGVGVVVALALALGLSGLIAACGNSGSELVTTASVVLPGGLSVTDASVGEGDRIAAGYMVLTASGSGDRLLEASSPAATRVTLHSTAAGGAMKAVDGLDLPPGVPVSLSPGGDHLMLEGLSTALVPGSTVVVDLTFESAGEVQLVVPVVALVDVLDVYDRGW